MSKLKSLEQEHQRLLNSHNQTEVSFNVCEHFYKNTVIINVRLRKPVLSTQNTPIHIMVSIFLCVLYKICKFY